MVELPEGFCIDATEVTRNQYAAWLATTPPTYGQPYYCTWNDTYEPNCEWPPGSKGEHPVVCVDWCDAHAYCVGVSKRLCGKIGGGMNNFDDHANASTSQWYAACSSGSTNEYPYGAAFSGTTCNGDEAGYGATLPVASMTGCQSSVNGYNGVYDLSGNVWEWEDSCDKTSGASDKCRLRGGSFRGLDNDLRCDYGVVENSDRNYQYAGIGFRCCSSP